MTPEEHLKALRESMSGVDDTDSATDTATETWPPSKSVDDHLRSLMDEEPIGTPKEPIPATDERADIPDDDPVARKEAELAAIAEVPEDQRYNEQEGFLMGTLQKLDYPANVTRALIYGALDPNPKVTALGVAGQAINREREISPETLAKQMGYINLGVDDGSLDVGDVADAARNFGIGVLTDPMTFLISPTSFALKKIAGVPKAVGKLGPSATKAILADKALSNTKLVKDVFKAQMIEKGVGSGAMGAAAFGGTEGDLLEKTANGAATAAIFAVGPYALHSIKGSLGGQKVIEKGRQVIDAVVDHVRAIPYGPSAIGSTHAARMGGQLDDKVKGLAQWLMDGRLKALEHLNPEEKQIVSDFFQDKIGKVIEAREKAKAGASAFNDLIQKESNLRGLIGEGGSPDQLKAWTKELDDVVKQKRIHFNTMTEKINQRFDPNLAIANVRRQHGERVAESVQMLVDHNKEFVERMNKEVYGEASGKWNKETGKGIAGLVWHTDNPNYKFSATVSPDIMDEADDIFKHAKTPAFPVHEKTMGVRGAATKEMDRDLSYAIYAANRAKSWATKEEKEALELLGKFNKAKEEFWKNPNGFMEAGRKLVVGFDWLTKRMKDKQLALSTSWLKNNFYGNVAAAFAENGIIGAVDTATFAAFNKGLASDIVNLSKQNAHSYITKHPDSKYMLKHGVLDNSFFDKRTGELAEFFYTPEQAAKMKPSGVGAFINKQLDRIAAPGYAIGSYIEGSAKAMSFIRTKKMLMNTGLDADDAARIAADTTKRMFFDYKNVHAIENAVLKRAIPFWTFYSRNVGLWARNMTSSKSLQRIRIADIARSQMGRQPTAEEYKEIPEYNMQAPTVTSSPDADNLGVLSWPNIPAIDALSTFGDMIQFTPGKTKSPEYVEKANPILKGIYEGMSGRDLFFGAPLQPSEYVKTKKDSAGDLEVDSSKEFTGKAAGSTGYGKARLEEILKGQGVSPVVRDVLGVYGHEIDDEGRPRVMKDTSVPRPLEVIRENMPFNPLAWPVAHQVYSAYRKGEQDPDNAAMYWGNLLSPWRFDSYSPEQRARTRSFTRSKK